MDPRLPLHVHPDIHRAKTLPGWVYSDPGTYQLLLRKAFGPSWQWLPVIEPPAAVSGCLPFRLLPGSLDEPLLLTRDDAGLHDDVVAQNQRRAGEAPLRRLRAVHRRSNAPSSPRTRRQRAIEP